METVLKKIILLVEDEPFSAVATAAMLKNSGYGVVTASDASRAIKAVETDPGIELILMDIDLGPGINGPDAAREILKLRDIPIVFLTSHSEREMVDMVREITRYGYVIKNSGDFVLLSSIEMAFELFESQKKFRLTSERLAESEKNMRRKLDIILKPDAELPDINLHDIIDREAFQLIIDRFFALTNIGIGIVDLYGNVVLSAGWQDICTRFHRLNPGTLKNCIESDTILTSGISEGEYRIYKCGNNMWKVTTPVIVDGKLLGNILLGQFLFDDEDPGESFFIDQAKRYGFNEADYLDALGRVPRLSRDKVRHIMEFYAALAGLINRFGFSNLRLAKTITERDRAFAALNASEDLFSKAFYRSPQLMAVSDIETGIYIEVNDKFCSVSGYTRDEIVGRSSIELGILTAESRTQIREQIEKEGYIRGNSIRIRKKDGKMLTFIINVDIIYPSGIPRLLSISEDITDKFFAFNEREATVQMMELISSDRDGSELVREAVTFFRKWSGCEAVAVRMKDGDDYPYYVTEGFGEDFIKIESSLCARDVDGAIVRDDVGNPVLDCMCGNILQGRFDPAKPFFSEYGSFWTNSTTELLATTTEADRQARTRNRCNGEGYESVALIPLKHESSVYGLIQMNDRSKDKFTGELIGLFERLASSIAISIYLKLITRKLETSDMRYRLLVENSPVSIVLVRKGKYIFANPAAAARLGFGSPDELKDYPVEKTLFPGAMDEHKNRKTETGHGHASPPLEMMLVRKDGTSVVAMLQSLRVLLDDGPALMIIGQDLTKEKQMEKQLQENAEKYRTIADFTSDWEFWVGVDGKMKYVSPSCEDISGYTASEFVNDPELLKSIIFPEDHGSPCIGIGNITEHPVSNEAEFRIRTKNGDVRWIAHACRAVYDSAGNFAGRRGSNRDVTRRYRIESELRNTYDRLESLWKIAMLVDADFRTICDTILESIVKISSSPYGFYGFINEDESVMTIYSWSGMAMSDCKMEVKPMVYNIAESGIWAEAVRHRKNVIINDYGEANPAKKGCPEGHVNLKRIMVIPFMRSNRIISLAAVANKETDYSDSDALILKSFLANIQAVVDSKRNGDALRESEQKLKLLMNATTDGAFLMDNDGVILESNNTFAERFGIKSEEIIGVNIYSLLPEPLAESRRGIVKRIIESRKPEYFEGERNGVLLENSAYPVMNNAGEVVSLAVFSRDITESRKSQWKIQNLLEQKEMLLCEVHHRIKNNMNTIAGLLQLQSLSIDDPAAIAALDDARSRVQNMMLIYDRLYRSANCQNLGARNYFENLVDEIVRIFPNYQRVRVLKNIDDFNLDSKVLFNAGIMINELITNSFKYAFTGTDDPELVFELSRDRGKMIIVLKDNGSGLPEHVINGSSEGFGLNLVATLAEQMDGKMKFGTGPGTEIIVTLDLHQQ